MEVNQRDGLYAHDTTPVTMFATHHSAIFGSEKSGGRIAELHEGIYRTPVLAD